MNQVVGMARLKSQAQEMAQAMASLANCCKDIELQSYSRFGLTVAEGRFLETIAEGGFSTPSALAEALSVTRSRITRIADGLVRKGFIERCESKNDRRYQSLCLTEKGREVLNYARTYIEDTHVRLLRAFDDTKRAALLDDLKLLKQEMDIIRREI